MHTGSDSLLVYVLQIVGRGHFATVFQGTYQGSVVAVKFLPAAYEHNFNTEKEIYELLLSKHTSIVNFLGTGRKPDDKSWFIVLQFAEYVSENLCTKTTAAQGKNCMEQTREIFVNNTKSLLQVTNRIYR